MSRRSAFSVSTGLASVAALCAVSLLSAQQARAVDVPSGQPVTLQEVLIDTVGAETWLRFRFVAERITMADDAEATAQDMGHLCVALALPYIAEYQLDGDVIVISLADRVTEFGVAAPEATQFFEAYRPSGKTCIWEGV